MKLITHCAVACQDIREGLLERVAAAAASTERLSVHCVASLELCDDASIRQANREQRGMDRVTDVLSFPTITYPEGVTAANAGHLLMQEWDTSHDACFLGDILISVPQARAQAHAYGHSFERELTYLLVHGLMHLFGYDHQAKEEKSMMRKMEEAALERAQAPLADEDALLEAARQALKQAYVPYSNYQVGAALLGKDGRVYTGCNVENASFGLTNCAERTALFKAVSEGCTGFDAVAIAAQGLPPWPCGACRQVLSEFCTDIPVLVTWDDVHVERTTLQELLPHSFSPATGASDVLKKG